MPSKVIDTENAFFRLALDSCPDLVFVKSEDLKITYANKAMLELYAPEARAHILGTTTVENFSPAEAEVFLAADYETLEVGKTQRIETIVDYAGKQRIISTTKTRFTNQWGRPCILGVSTDVTLLVERGNRLRRTNEALERYAANAAHDLASPLSTLSMIGELIQMDPDSNLSDATQRRLQDGINIVAGLATQVKALLLICKAESAGTVDQELVPLELIVDRVKTSLSAVLHRTGANLICEDPSDIKCHSTLIEAVLQNLIENSLKYRDKRHPVIRVERISLGTVEKITVADNGIGIPAESAKRLFAPRTQLDPSKAGAGLGLAMCRNIVELHGGDIWVENYGGEGARISFTLGGPRPCDDIPRFIERDTSRA